jgi:2,3-bisphosphoglycerate-independent phosphoglycerate mutase
MNKHVGLIILDGWGIGNGGASDAIAAANTPVMDRLMRQYPHATLTTFGEKVGLPEGQMGNSEVGHLNIGAGRVVYQELTRINKEIREGGFFENKILLDAFNKAKAPGKKLHLMGLLSDGGVHSSKEHLFALCKMAADQGVKEVYIHAITDGRDCDPKSAIRFLKETEEIAAKYSFSVASMVGRYYAMDRDQRWERIKVAYDLLIHGVGKESLNSDDALNDSYAEGITDEFLNPVILNKKGLIGNNDVLINFNFRTDRPREITIALTQKAFPEYQMFPLELDYFSMTNYDVNFKNIHIIYDKDNLTNTLGEVIAKAGLSQLRIAETEKYPHVTFFFNGGREVPFSREERIMVNSPKVATYDLQPEMSALEVCALAKQAISSSTPNFLCLNFANPDMVGHTGVFPAIVKAIETVDTCLGELIETGLEKGYEFIVIADHGNADFAINDDGTPNTAHSMNPVPVLLVSSENNLKLKEGILADIAPTILQRLNLDLPNEMSGISLIKY